MIKFVCQENDEFIICFFFIWTKYYLIIYDFINSEALLFTITYLYHENVKNSD